MTGSEGTADGRDGRDADAWVGIDLGTQSVRAVVVDTSGGVLGVGAHPIASHRDGSRHEQDPEDWWTGVTAACRAALAEIAPGRIGGLAVDSTSGTILLADATGTPLTPGLMYDDGRAVAEAEQVNEAGAEAWAALGYRRMQPSWALPKLVRLVREHPELIRRPGARLCHQADFVNRRLVGRTVAADSSHALKTGYHLRDDRWPEDVFDRLGIPARLLPDVVRPGSVLGTVGAKAAAETGLPQGTPVVAGMTDGCAAQLGAGALEVGSWNCVLGTTLVLKGVAAEPVADPSGVVYSHRAPDGHWLPGGASSTGAGVLSTLFPGRDLAALDAAAAAREPGSDPAAVVTYPPVSTGERFPFVAPDAERFVLGEPRDEVDHYAAVLRGVAFVERLCFDHLDSLGAPIDGPISFTGGGARSAHWNRLRARILGRSVRLPADGGSALGMAILAAGRTRPAETAARMVEVRGVIEPEPDSSARFAAAYVRLVDELERRGWLPAATANHARNRIEEST